MEGDLQTQIELRGEDTLVDQDWGGMEERVMILRAYIPMVNMSYEGNDIGGRAHSTLGERLLISAERVIS